MVFSKPRGNLPVQVRMVGLEIEYVISLRIDDGFGDGLLTPHGINGDDAAFQSEELQQLRDGRDLVGFFVRLYLPQQHAVLTRPGAHDMQG